MGAWCMVSGEGSSWKPDCCPLLAVVVCMLAPAALGFFGELHLAKSEGHLLGHLTCLEDTTKQFAGLHAELLKKVAS